MRIAFITSEFPVEGTVYGGLATYIAKIAKLLVKSGHTVDVFTFADINEFKLDHFGASIYGIPPKWLSIRGIAYLDKLIPNFLDLTYHDLKGALSLKRACALKHAREPYDVIQISNVRAVGLFFDPKRFPVLMRLSSYRRLWDRLAGIPQTTRYLLRCRLEEKSIQKQRSIYSPTSYVARLSESKLSLGNRSIRVIHTPFISTIKHPSSKALLPAEPYILFFGRLTMMKGVHILIEAIDRVFKTHANIRLVLAGRDGPGPDGKSMHEHVSRRSKHFSDRITLHDAVPHEELFPLIGGAEFVVLPSLADNLPNTLLEALAFGKRVVATTGSCFEDHLLDPRAGILVEPDNIEALADAIIEMIEMPEDEKLSMTEAAQRHVNKLSPEIVIPQIERHYREFIESRNCLSSQP